MREGIFLAGKLATVADLRQADDLSSVLVLILGGIRDSDCLVAPIRSTTTAACSAPVISSAYPMLTPLGPAEGLG